MDDILSAYIVKQLRMEKFSIAEQLLTYFLKAEFFKVRDGQFIQP